MRLNRDNFKTFSCSLIVKKTTTITPDKNTNALAYFWLIPKVGTWPHNDGLRFEVEVVLRPDLKLAADFDNVFG